MFWKPDYFESDFTKIHTKEELEKIEKEKNSQSMSSEWTTTNEDLWRYFGYEKWANNYVKLPWNLTMQVNQWMEFTDIWFLFLVLIPAILLFLPFRRNYYWFLIVIILILELLVFVKTDNNIIDNTKLSSFSTMSEEAKSAIFQRNDKVFSKSIFNKDIYDINISNYISRTDIKSLVNKETPYSVIEPKVKEAFYSELKDKVLNPELWNTLSINKKNLSKIDFEFIKELNSLTVNYSSFNKEITSIASLEEIINKLWLKEYKNSLINLWKQNRTTNQLISDFLASYNLPYWYIILLLIFIIPNLFFLLLLDNDKDWENSKILDLFKKNFVFASFYTFLWSISAFWIVWYWITMYFNFLIIIWIWIYFLSSYSDKDWEKIFYTKLFWSILLFLIIIIYFTNSVFPHSFLNLKWAWYQEYKIWTVKTVDAPYSYHQEYFKELFYLNIDQNKKEDFLKEYIKSDIKDIVPWIEKKDIETVRAILLEIKKRNDLLSKFATFSLNDIYKNISNPPEKYKNKDWVYRIWTFMKYHISENNTRLLEDGLLFNFSDYIYDKDSNKTVENFSKLWAKYLLVDLNAATIDKDERHNLTTRYEKLLSTFVSEKLELVDTDSICLRVALEDYNKSSKTEQDMKSFLEIAWVNYESYTNDWTQIPRTTKLLKCYNRINDLMNTIWAINTNSYTYLMNISNYMKQNKESYQTENQIYGFFQQQINHGFKVLFKIR